MDSFPYWPGEQWAGTDTAGHRVLGTHTVQCPEASVASGGDTLRMCISWFPLTNPQTISDALAELAHAIGSLELAGSRDIQTFVQSYIQRDALTERAERGPLRVDQATDRARAPEGSRMTAFPLISSDEEENENDGNEERAPERSRKRKRYPRHTPLHPKTPYIQTPPHLSQDLPYLPHPQTPLARSPFL